MRTVSILSAAAIALVMAGPLSAYASRGRVDSGTGPTEYYQPDPAALALEQQDYQTTLARQHAVDQQKAQGSQPTQNAQNSQSASMSRSAEQ
jgi:hypothetical protein